MKERKKEKKKERQEILCKTSIACNFIYSKEIPLYQGKEIPLKSSFRS